MSRIRKLLNSYVGFISVPWKTDAAAAQRVIFCVYNESDELKLRAHIDEFEIASKQACPYGSGQASGVLSREF